LETLIIIQNGGQHKLRVPDKFGFFGASCLFNAHEQTYRIVDFIGGLVFFQNVELSKFLCDINSVSSYAK
jgi:hypothetical protein